MVGRIGNYERGRGVMDAMALQAHPVNADRKAPLAPAATTAIRAPEWFPRWEGATCAIVASGPSAAKAGVEQLRGRVRVIAINTSYQLAPWADVLYACDQTWWKWNKGAPDFRGLKVTQAIQACSQFKDVRLVKVEKFCNELLLDKPGTLGAGGNSGFQALNLALQFGVKRILLIGYDMRIDLGEHWHKRHPAPMSNPHPVSNLPRWRKALDGAAPKLKALGVEVINCSPVSELRAYPKKSLDEVLNGG